MTPLAQPHQARRVVPFAFDISAEDIREVQAATERILSSGQLILGEYTERFEREFATFVGSRYAVSVSTGSAALEILCRIKRVEHRRVLVPTNTNFATVAAVLRCGGVVSCLDMDPATFAPTLEMVAHAAARHPDCAGVIWVHVGGVVSPEFLDVVDWCRTRDLFVLEDAAHAHGSEIGAMKAGNAADGGAFSFFATKVMATGEGGMVVTNDEQEARLAESLRNQGKRGVKFGGCHEDFGNSARMTELQCALGSAQLRRLPQMLERRARAAAVVVRHLEDAGIPHCSTHHMTRASHYKLVVRLPPGRDLADCRTRLRAAGIETGGGVYEIPCHRQPVFAGRLEPGVFPNADRWCPAHLCPPLTSRTTEAEAALVGAALVEHLS